MKTSVMYLISVFLLFNCREKPEAEKRKVEEIVTKEKAILPVPKLVVELGEFADVTFLDISEVHQFFDFKQIDVNQTITTIDLDRAIALYRKMMKREKAVAWPIFELKGGDNAILLVEGVGFGGAIWAKVLVDRGTLEIKKIEFEHKAESDGYGAVMTQSSFEDKFVGTKIDLEKNTFTLQKNIEKRIDDGTYVDGISGATMTSQAVLKMVNEGLRKYKEYLRP